MKTDCARIIDVVAVETSRVSAAECSRTSRALLAVRPVKPETETSALKRTSDPGSIITSDYEQSCRTSFAERHQRKRTHLGCPFLIGVRRWLYVKCLELSPTIVTHQEETTDVRRMGRPRVPARQCGLGAASGEQEKHRFTLYEADAESGNDYAKNRHYSSAIARFQQADPYRPSGRIIDPQSWNRYAYTRNEPINRIDPTGLEDTPSDDWDYKKGKGNGKYAPFGNFNFGAVGAALGIPLETLLRGAGWVQKHLAQLGSSGDGIAPELWEIFTGGGTYPYEDQVEDQEQIKAGAEYYYRTLDLNGPRDCP